MRFKHQRFDMLRFVDILCLNAKIVNLFLNFTNLSFLIWRWNSWNKFRLREFVNFRHINRTSIFCLGGLIFIWTFKFNNPSVIFELILWWFVFLNFNCYIFLFNYFWREGWECLVQLWTFNFCHFYTWRRWFCFMLFKHDVWAFIFFKHANFVLLVVLWSKLTIYKPLFWNMFSLWSLFFVLINKSKIKRNLFSYVIKIFSLFLF